MNDIDFEEYSEMPTNGNDKTNILTGMIPSAKKIKEYLDQYVIGQDDVKKVLAVAVHNHYKRIQAKLDVTNDVEIEKSNILLCGPTGTGKTLLAKSLAKMLGVPFAIADATTLTQAGYVGEDVENVVRYLWQNADYNNALTQMGIIYIDEIDKIASKTDNVSISRDVSGEGVQQALLKIIEGTICRFPPNGGRKHPDQELVEIDTSNILFICGGAFVGLDKIVESRTESHSIGFNTCDEDKKKKKNEDHITKTLEVQPQDLVKFGLIPEFTGRLPIIASMNELTEDDLVKILTEPKNSIVKQYKRLLELDGVDLSFKTDALREIAKTSIERNTGARGLRAVLENVMIDVMFNIDDNKTKKIQITKKMLNSLVA